MTTRQLPPLGVVPQRPSGTRRLWTWLRRGLAALATLAALVLLVAILPAGPAQAAPGATPAHEGLSVSGYAYTTQVAAEAALATGNYAGGRWVVRAPVIRAYGRVYYTNAGWVVAFVFYQPTGRDVNRSARYKTGFDVFWFTALGQDTAPFWW